MSEQNQPYFREIHNNQEDSLFRISQFIGQNATVLDLGPGSGALGKYLKERKFCIIDGVEKNLEYLADNKSYYRNLYSGDLESNHWLELISQNKFDFVVLADVLEHLRAPDDLLRRLAATLKPDGHLLLSVPNIAHAGVILELIEGKFEYRNDGLLDSTHIHFFTRTSLIKLLSNCGYIIVRMEIIKKDIRQTEFKDSYLDACPPSVIRSILSQPDAFTYQFIIDAVFNPQMALSSNDQFYEKLPTQNHLNFGCQLFYALESGEFNSIQCINSFGIIGSEDQNIDFEFPAIDFPVGKLRVDLSDRPGLLILIGMQLLDNENRVLWDWNGDYKYIEDLTMSQIKVSSEMQNTIIMYGDDPSMELKIPSNILAKIGQGCSFRLRVGWPVNADLSYAFSQIQAHKDQVTQSIINRDQVISMLTETRVQLEAVKNERDQVFSMLTETRAELERVDNEIKAYLNSTIWKITKLLRYIKDQLF
jgi:2-polyprenyl-3-methyl-5-hydroxy-6-metoxy-1,4-benzoquinol methylase